MRIGMRKGSIDCRPMGGPIGAACSGWQGAIVDIFDKGNVTVQLFPRMYEDLFYFNMEVLDGKI